MRVRVSDRSGIIAVGFLGDGAVAFVQERWVPITDCDCGEASGKTTEYRVTTDFGNGVTIVQDWADRSLALADLKERSR
jgi:hypothetical protein